MTPTETTTFSINKNDVQSFERKVVSVVVGTGKLVVTDGGEANTVSEGETYDAGNSTTLTVLALEGSNFSVTFAENAVAPVFQNVTAVPSEIQHAGEPVQRGDSDPESDTGGTGPFESRTVRELQTLAKDRGLTVTGKKGKKPVKGDFIKALRA